MDFCGQLQETPLSLLLQDHPDWIAFMQSIHILAISFLAISMLILNLNLYQGATQHARLRVQFRPLIHWSLPTLLITGSLMIVAEPARSLANDAFQIKMMMLLLVLILYFWVSQQVEHATNRFVRQGQATASAKFIAFLSMALWMGIVFSGRWIAYLM
jgi:hypothetical protein